MPSEFVGVDGCKVGWVSVGFSVSGEYELKTFFSFAELVEHYAAAKLILVDMPIGLPEGPAERLCDPEARKALGLRAPSVFRAPTRQALQCLARNPADRDAVKAVQSKITRKSLTNQTLEIMRKIHEIDRLMFDRGPNAIPQVREIHPEVCFWALNNRHPMRFKKQDTEGINERLRVLDLVESRTREIFRVGRAEFPGKTGSSKFVGDDDILDALSAAVTAHRGWPNQLQALPENNAPQKDGRGLPMEMVFWEPSLR